MQTLPLELDYKIFLFLPVESILNMCQINKRYNICDNEYFWRDKVELDYSDYFKYKPYNKTWRDTYLNLAKNKIRSFPIIYNDEYIGDIWLRYDNSQSEVYSLITQFVKQISGVDDEMIVNTKIIGDEEEYTLVKHQVLISEGWDDIEAFSVEVGQYNSEY